MAEHSPQPNTSSASEKLAALQELSSAILCTDDIGTLGNLMLDCAMTLTDAKRASIMVPHSGNSLRIIAARGLDPAFMYKNRVIEGKGIADRVMQAKTACWTKDIESDEKLRPFRKAQYQSNSFISCPIVPNSVSVGVLNVSEKKDLAAFDSADLAIIQMLANQTAAAFDRAFLIEQLSARIEELEETQDQLVRERKLEAEFALRCSDELRTPINSIRGAVLYLQQRAARISPTEQQDFYQIMSQETERMLKTVQNLLTTLKLNTDAHENDAVPINFRELAEYVVRKKAVREMLAKSSVKMTLSIRKNLSDVVVDKSHYADLITQIMELTLRYMQKGDVVNVSADDNSHAKLMLRYPRRLPEPLIAMLDDFSREASSEQQELRLRLGIIRKMVDAKRWELRAENKDAGSEILLGIPKNTRANRELIARNVLNRFADYICELLEIDTCSIMVIDPLTNQLTIQGAHGLSPTVMATTRLDMGERIAGKVALTGEPLLIEDIEEDKNTMKLNRPFYNTRSLLSVPLRKNGRIFGVLNLSNKRAGSAFTKTDLDLASVIGIRIANIIEGTVSAAFSESDFKMHLVALDKLIDGLRKHERKTGVFLYMRALAHELQMPDEKRQHALYASLLFDLGLALLNPRLTEKKSLDPAELSVIRTHSRGAVCLIGQFETSDEICSAILHHHERYDGSGYPDGLSGERIPLIARMLAVVDAYVAMTSDRIYRKSMSAAKALNEIIAGAGTLYDPAVVAAFQRVVQQDSHSASHGPTIGNA